MLTGLDAHNFKDMKAREHLTKDEKLFDTLLLSHAGAKTFSQLKDKFYNYGYLINKGYGSDITEDDIKKRIDYLNERLKNADLLISAHKIRPTLFYCFIKAIKDINLQEIEQNDITLESVEARNKDFFMMVVAEFIIQANDYYTKEEIKQFLEERILDE